MTYSDRERTQLLELLGCEVVIMSCYQDEWHTSSQEYKCTFLRLTCCSNVGNVIHTEVISSEGNPKLEPFLAFGCPLNDFKEYRNLVYEEEESFSDSYNAPCRMLSDGGRVKCSFFSLLINHFINHKKKMNEDHFRFEVTYHTLGCSYSYA